MDDGDEGISWLGNMVQKFEDLLSEVDMQEELTSFTNQLQTVGASVMQFCLDIVEDKYHQLLENREKERASDIGVMDSHALKISVGENHCETESCNENDLLCSSSVEPTDGIQFDPSVEENVDIKVYEKSGVIGKENLVKDKQSQHEMPLVVCLKEDKQHETSDVVFPNMEESNNFENAYSYISSPTPSSCSDYSYEPGPDAEVTPAVASTESPNDSSAHGISDNVVTKSETGTVLSLQKVKRDENLEEEELDLKSLDTILEVLASARRQESHISFLRREKPHYSMMKTITQNLDQIVKEEEEEEIVQNFKQIVLQGEKLREFLNTQEHESCDSDWVIV